MIQSFADPLLERLAQDLESEGYLRSPEWRKAFRKVYRHVFVPQVLRREGGKWKVLDGEDPRSRADWLRLVYSDTVLGVRADAHNVLTSSSTSPGVMAEMLEALDLSDGDSILEIGTGTGYNAALLCERLDSESVTTIDIDPELVEEAADHLHAHGYSPLMAVANGGYGYKPRAPYDRIIGTCGVRRVPEAWIQQTRPGGTIVGNIRGAYEGGIARLTVISGGAAEGRFLAGQRGFLPIREGHSLGLDQKASVSISPANVAYRELQFTIEPLGSSFWFMLNLSMPESVVGTSTTQSYPVGLFIVDAKDGSWAQVDRASGSELYIRCGGPSPLWDVVEHTHEAWESAGKPDRDRYGIAVTSPVEQIVWLDDPGCDQRWRLPT